MNTQKMYQVDAFTDRVFGGNPAAVCPLDNWLSDETMQHIAMENNLAETAFYVRQGTSYELRWFTPTVEVDLCGHATLAAAYVLFHHEGHLGNEIAFDSPRSGPLTVTRQGDLLTLNFPADEMKRVELTPELSRCFDKQPVEVYMGKTDYMLAYESQADVESIRPSLVDIAALGGRGAIITAPGDEVDFVSRFFAPQAGVDEDPVTGSAHTTLTPYWAGRLGKAQLTARQLSKRGGALQCTHKGSRVEISGQARLYLTGEIHVNESN